MILERLKDVMVSKLNIEKNEISEETSFEDLGLDSLDIVELTMAVEEEFGIEIETQEEMKTVGDIVSYIESKM